MNPPLRSLVAVLLVLAATAASGATRYVTDELRISVRTGQGTQYRIVEVIDTGTPVEVLQEAGNWVQVRTPAGKEGWVLGQYLDTEPIAAEQLQQASAELERARERITELEAALATARSESEVARERIEELSARVESLQADLEKARAGLDLADENARLRDRVAGLARRVTELQEAVRSAAERSQKEWFLIGGGVLFGGMLFGIIVTRIPWRRRRDRMF